MAQIEEVLSYDIGKVDNEDALLGAISSLMDFILKKRGTGEDNILEEAFSRTMENPKPLGISLQTITSH